MPKHYGGSQNQTQSAASDKKWRDKVKYDRLSVTVFRICGYSIKQIAHADIKLAKNQRLAVTTHDKTLTYENLHLEVKGKEYEPIYPFGSKFKKEGGK